MLKPGYGQEDYLCPKCKGSLVDLESCQRCGWRPGSERGEAVDIPIDELKGIHRRVAWLLEHADAEGFPPDMLEVLNDLKRLTSSGVWPKSDRPLPRPRKKRRTGSPPKPPRPTASKPPKSPNPAGWVKCRYCKVEVKKDNLRKHELHYCDVLRSGRGAATPGEGKRRRRRRTKKKQGIARPDLVPTPDRAICPLCKAAMKESNLARHLRRRCPKRDSLS